MINYDLKHLFEEDSVKKNIYIPCGNFVLTNDDLISEEFTLTERLCSASQLEFGGCEASELSFKFKNNNYPSMVNKLLNGAYMTLDDHSDKPFTIGTYRVYSDKLSKDRKTREIVAYDLLYDILNADVTSWYKSLSFPITVKQMRDSFFQLLGIDQQITTLINDDLSVNKNISDEHITGETIIKAICEINGVFGHMNRENVFVYVGLTVPTDKKIYPSYILYPSTSLWPTHE